MEASAQSGDGRRWHAFGIQAGRCAIECLVVAAGPDAVIAVSGGDAPHVGSTACAEPRPSLAGAGASATVSVLNRTGHKDDAVACELARRVCVATGGAVSCSCGIHIDGAAPSDLQDVVDAVPALADEAVRFLTGSDAPRPAKAADALGG